MLYDIILHLFNIKCQVWHYNNPLNYVHFNLEGVMSTKQLLGAKIRYLRKSKKIAQEKLSEMADISPRQMVRIEMGQSFPTIENLEKIAAALDVPIQSLFENDYYDSTEILKKKLHEKIDILDEKNTRFLYLIASNLD